MNPFLPSISLLVKLGSIAVHADELTSADGHQFDAAAIRSLLADPDIAEWIRQMNKEAFLPIKRK